MKHIRISGFRILLSLSAAVFLILLWHAKASALTMEQTFVAGDCIAVVDFDPDGHGPAASRFTVTAQGAGSNYNILYAAGTAEQPFVQYYYNYTKNISTEPTAALLRPTNREGEGIVLWLSVISGSLKLTVNSSASAGPLTLVRTGIGPLYHTGRAKGKSIQLRTANINLSSIPILLGGTNGTQVKHIMESNRYELYKFTSSALYIYTYVDGKKKKEESFSYDTSYNSGGSKYYCTCLQSDISPIGATGWFLTTLGSALYAMPADWLEFQYAGGGSASWDQSVPGWSSPAILSTGDYLDITLLDWGAVIEDAPEFSPAGGEYYSAQTVTISCASEGAVIRYTTDGTEPTPESPVYTGPITVDSSVTIKAVAAKEGHADSPVVAADYIIIHGTGLDLPGSGTEADPWQIGSALAWEMAAASIRNGLDINNRYFVLTADISVSSMMGTDTVHPFSGTFDGAGHTLTFNLENSPVCVAPFQYISGATIRNLHVAGSVMGDNVRASGLIGENSGSSTVTNCRVSVALSGTYLIGGFSVGTGDSLTITRSVFDGQITGTQGQCGCFVAWGTGGLTVADCLAAPQGGSAFAGGTFCYEGVGAPTLANCYYLTPIGTAQGKQARSVTAGEGVIIDFGESAAACSVSGITAYATGLKYGDTFYAGPDETVTLELSSAGFSAGYAASAGTLAEANGAYTLTMPDGNVIISTEIIPVFSNPDFTLPAFLAAIAEEAFEGAGMDVVYIGDNCTAIGDHAFRNCANLRQIRIPADCTLGTDVFEQCRLVYIYGAAGSPAEAYCSAHDNCVFVEEAQD